MGCGSSAGAYQEKPEQLASETAAPKVKVPPPPVPEGSSKEEHLQTASFTTCLFSCPFVEHDGHYMAPGGYSGEVVARSKRLALHMKKEKLVWNPYLDGSTKVTGVKAISGGADPSESIETWKLIAANVQRTGGMIYIYFRKDLEGKFTCDAVNQKGGSLDGRNQVDEIESAVSLGCKIEWLSYDSSQLLSWDELEQREVQDAEKAAKFEDMAKAGQQKLQAREMSPKARQTFAVPSETSSVPMSILEGHTAMPDE